jgi:nucleoside-diphosphate-sugar epimerase
VLRPRFILGAGDRHTLPGLLALARRRVGVGSGRQAFSVIDVDDYAEIILDACTRLMRSPRSQVLHVAYRRPLALDEITGALRRRFGLGPTRVRIPTSPRLFHVLGRMRRTAALGGKLELVGLPHHVSVSKLSVLAPEIVARDPAEALGRAIDNLQPSKATP